MGYHTDNETHADDFLSESRALVLHQKTIPKNKKKRGKKAMSSKYEEIRKEEENRILSNVRDYCGRNGRASELRHANTKSRKVKVASQNAIDDYIKVNMNGKIRYIGAENKINGGRLDQIFTDSRIKYVIYEMIDLPIPQSKKAKAENRPTEYRNVPAVVIPKNLFLAKLKEFNAIKVINRNGQFDGYGIQATSKKWYEWLLDYPVLWEKDYTYEIWEFEGLE
jgi:hypothetical protein